MLHDDAWMFDHPILSSNLDLSCMLASSPAHSDCTIGVLIWLCVCHNLFMIKIEVVETETLHIDLYCILTIDMKGVFMKSLVCKSITVPQRNNTFTY